MGTSFDCQAKGLKEAGFPDGAIASTCEKIRRAIKQANDAVVSKPATQERKRVEKVLYVNWLSHAIKRVASR